MVNDSVRHLHDHSYSYVLESQEERIKEQEIERHVASVSNIGKSYHGSPPNTSGHVSVIKANPQHLDTVYEKVNTVVNESVYCPTWLQKYIIERKGAGIQKNSQDLQKVHIGFNNDDSIKIDGPPDEVKKAVADLERQANVLIKATSFAEIKVDGKYQKHIGKEGSTINKIMTEADVTINIPDTDSGVTVIRIEGNKTGVEKAKKELIDMIIALIMENRFHRQVIVPQVENIIGTQKAVESAKQVMEAKDKELDNIVEDTMTVNPKYHKHFVAKRGEVLRRIGDEFGGVVVSFPRNGVQSDKVTLKGAKNFISAAMDKINEIVKDLEDQVTIDCEIEQSFHRTVKGSKVQKITTDFNVQIQFPDKATENGGESNGVTNGERSSNIIKITGKKDNCENASKALLELVPITAEVAVAFEFHRFIIGQKGKYFLSILISDFYFIIISPGTGVRDLMNKFDVNIRVPAQDAQSDIILISGVPKNVEAAKEGLAEKVAELEKKGEEKVLKSFEVKVKVAPKYIPKIIGRSGEVISKIRTDFNVMIQLPRKDAEEQSIITITGYEQNAKDAKDAILKIVGQFESFDHEKIKELNNITEDIVIDPKYDVTLEDAKVTLVNHIKATNLPLSFRPPTRSDGNCWYDAVADQVQLLEIPDKPTDHADVRDQVTKSLLNLPQTPVWIQNFFNNSNVNFRNFIARHRRPGTYTDNLGILCQATAFYLGKSF